jgi:hypothetical protein
MCSHNFIRLSRQSFNEASTGPSLAFPYGFFTYDTVRDAMPEV